MSWLTTERAQELLSGLIRVGRVSEVGGEGRVRVTLEDRDGIESGLLQVCHAKSGDNCMPSLGDSVLCVMMPPDQIDGFVVGTLYDQQQGPPTDEPEPRVVYSEDLRLGSVDAEHKVPLGDVLLKVLNGLRELLATVQVATPAGPGQLTAVTTDYGSGTVATIASQLAADVQDGVLLSQTVRVEE